MWALIPSKWQNDTLVEIVAHTELEKFTKRWVNGKMVISIFDIETGEMTHLTPSKRKFNIIK